MVLVVLGGQEVRIRVRPWVTQSRLRQKDADSGHNNIRSRTAGEDTELSIREFIINMKT